MTVVDGQLATPAAAKNLAGAVDGLTLGVEVTAGPFRAGTERPAHLVRQQWRRWRGSMPLIQAITDAVIHDPPGRRYGRERQWLDRDLKEP